MTEMSKLRLFIAIPLPPALVDRVAEVQRALDAGHPPIKWVRPEGLHLTLQFLGAVDARRVGELASALEGVAAGVRPCELELEGVGAFPNLRRPRVVWVGLSGEREALATLQAGVVGAMSRLGFAAEERAWAPHLTLGRVREDAGREAVTALGQAISRQRFQPEERWPVTTVALVMSTLRPEGSRYTILGEARLGEGGST